MSKMMLLTVAASKALFNAYLQRLRRARDQVEFDAFIADRKRQRDDMQGADGTSATSSE
jgi:Protein of unknown function (DUF2852)